MIVIVFKQCKLSLNTNLHLDNKVSGVLVAMLCLTNIHLLSLDMCACAQQPNTTLL